VTLAVLGVKLDQLAATVERYHEESCREMRERDGDHETRIRELEAAGRQGVWRDLAAFVTAVVAGVAGVLTGKT
jgi:hypothetical protein